RKRRLEGATVALRFVLGRGVEAVRDEVQEHALKFLRVEIDLSDRRVEVLDEGDVEARLLRARAVIGEVDTLLDQGIEIDGTMLSAALARMQKHVLDDRIGALAVLDDLLEI